MLSLLRGPTLLSSSSISVSCESCLPYVLAFLVPVELGDYLFWPAVFFGVVLLLLMELRIKSSGITHNVVYLWARKVDLSAVHWRVNQVAPDGGRWWLLSSGDGSRVALVIVYRLFELRHCYATNQPIRAFWSLELVTEAERSAPLSSYITN